MVESSGERRGRERTETAAPKPETPKRDERDEKTSIFRLPLGVVGLASARRPSMVS